jgi:mono/diheme cytochrome c family protein
MRRLHTALLVIVIGAIAGVASAKDQGPPGNARAGREFAGHNCDDCHVVARDQDVRPLVTGYAPSFFAIANKPETTPENLREFLKRQHAFSNMPYPDLMPADLANVVAYIMSLRHRQEHRESN